MLLIMGIAAGLVVLTLIAAMALGRAASSGADDHDRETIVDLGAVTSPTGKSFFPNGEAVWDLADALEDIRDEPGSGASGAPRQSTP